ncbi:MAG TPA: replication factor C small subunit [Candidatus Lokiarchaeia archaeon]|nr:replication factor C small subunit [Candidatus Lokiarchaeia archaeon]
MEEVDDGRPWVEKYRPKTLDDVVGHEKILNTLRAYVKEGNFPHLLFAGPAGTGKTSTAYAFSSDLLGGRLSKDTLLELNASDANSIEDMRTIVKEFALQQSVLASQHKIIILDEADNISRDAQSALRRIMESGNMRVRFIILCNYPNRIIDPILSRCAIFRFPRLPEQFITQKLEEIADKEGLQLAPDVFPQINYLSRGDMRQAITLLQVVGEFWEEEQLVGDPLYELSGFLPPSFLETLAGQLQSQTFSQLRDDVLAAVGGKSSRSVMLQLLALVPSLTMDAIKRAKIIDEIALCDYYITEGATESIQYSGLVAFLAEKLGQAK